MGDALEAALESGLVGAGAPLLVLLSGGADSVCLLDVCRELGADVSALHVNYGLRGTDSEADERHCAELCERLEVPLTTERVVLPEAGNLQAAARDARYAAAERTAAGDYAAAHTASDQAETVLYRLAVSPGRRALLGMEPRRGRLVRPLLGAGRADTRAWCERRGLAWREDASNADPRFARARVRETLLPALADLSPGAERAIAETALLLRDEAAVLDEEVDRALEGLGGGPAVALADLTALPSALARLVLRRLAEGAAGGPRALARADADRILALGGPGSSTLDLGAGLRAVAEYGTVRFAGPPPPVPDPVALPVPGAARFGDWEVSARRGSPGDAEVAPAALAAGAVVRAWREGDRMRPAGLGGTKTLQDLFTDRKVPRELRRTLPVVEAGGVIVWVAGVAVDEAAVPASEADPISLSARQVPRA
jgi:tRNA(Ile)-lysidine synthase